jgi:hypothetical protein
MFSARKIRANNNDKYDLKMLIGNEGFVMK